MGTNHEWVQHDQTQLLIKSIREAIEVFENQFRSGDLLMEKAEQTAMMTVKATAMIQAYESVLEFIAEVEED